MNVAMLSPLPVGLLAWNCPDPVATVIVKATFAVGDDGFAMLANDQLALSVDREASGDELYYASDFAPRKVGSDVLVVGHAQANIPQPEIDACVALPGLTIRVRARADRPTTQVPLLSAHLQGARTAPKRARVRGWLSRTVMPAFDFSAFNVAPAEHRVSHVAPGLSLALDGIMGAGARKVRLPNVTPAIYHAFGRNDVGRRIELRCDTVWVDSDQHRVVLVWRGTVERKTDTEPYLVSALAVEEHVPAWNELTSRLSAARWRPPTVQRDVDGSMPPRSDPRGLSGPNPTLALVDGVIPQSEEEPTIRAEDPVLRADDASEGTLAVSDADIMSSPLPFAGHLGQRKRQAARTMAIDEAEAAAFREQVFPFIQAADDVDDDEIDTIQEEGPESSAAETLDVAQLQAMRRAMQDGAETIVNEGFDPRPVVPFKPSDRPQAPPRATEESWRAMKGATITDEAAEALRKAIPFPPKVTSHGHAPVPPNPALELTSKRMAVKRPEPEPPTEPAPTKPKPEAEEPAIALEIYAGIKAALWDGGTTLGEALDEHDLDEATWRAHERNQAVAIAKDASNGRGELGKKVRAAILEARRRAKSE